MATVTELALFKKCVECPLTIKNFEDFNLDRIPDPTN